MIVEDKLDRNEFERFLAKIERERIDKFEIVDARQRAPSVLFRGEIQIHNRPVLRQVKPLLAFPDLLELLFAELPLLQQKIAWFFLDGASGFSHWSGTSISFFVFSVKMFVCFARFVNVRACMVASA